MNQTNRRRGFFVVIVLIGILLTVTQRKERSAIVAARLGPEIPELVKNDENPAAKNPARQKVEPSPEQDQAAIDEIRNEAKLTLAQVYSGSRSVHAEFERHTTDLKLLGWDPNETIMKMKIGFQVPYKPAKFEDWDVYQEDLRRIDSDSFNGTKVRDSEDVYSYTPAADAIRFSDYQSYCEEDCSANEDHFEIMAVVPLPNGKVDVWTINENKEFKLKLDGLK